MEPTTWMAASAALQALGALGGLSSQKKAKKQAQREREAEERRRNWETLTAATAGQALPQYGALPSVPSVDYWTPLAQLGAAAGTFGQGLQAKQAAEAATKQQAFQNQLAGAKLGIDAFTAQQQAQNWDWQAQSQTIDRGQKAAATRRDLEMDQRRLDLDTRKADIDLVKGYLEYTGKGEVTDRDVLEASTRLAGTAGGMNTKQDPLTAYLAAQKGLPAPAPGLTPQGEQLMGQARGYLQQALRGWTGANASDPLGLGLAAAPAAAPAAQPPTAPTGAALPAAGDPAAGPGYQQMMRQRVLEALQRLGAGNGTER